MLANIPDFGKILTSTSYIIYEKNNISNIRKEKNDKYQVVTQKINGSPPPEPFISEAKNQNSGPGVGRNSVNRGPFGPLFHSKSQKVEAATYCSKPPTLPHLGRALRPPESSREPSYILPLQGEQKHEVGPTDQLRNNQRPLCSPPYSRFQ